MIHFPSEMDRVHFIGQCCPTSADHFSLSSRMDYINLAAGGQFQPRIGFSRCSSEVDPIECAERVEAMVSTAILHQEDIWDMLLDLFPDNAAGMDVMSGKLAPSCQNAAAIKRKLQNAMDWCRLAQCRLQGIITEKSSNTSSKTRSIQSAAGGW